jgi:hypothetical protein
MIRVTALALLAATACGNVTESPPPINAMPDAGRPHRSRRLRAVLRLIVERSRATESGSASRQGRAIYERSACTRQDLSR